MGDYIFCKPDIGLLPSEHRHDSGECMEKHVRRFGVLDKRGLKVFIDEYQEFIDVTTKDSTTREFIGGLKRLEISGRGAVNMIDDNTFEIVSTGEQLTIPR